MSARLKLALAALVFVAAPSPGFSSPDGALRLAAGYPIGPRGRRRKRRRKSPKKPAEKKAAAPRQAGPVHTLFILSSSTINSPRDLVGAQVKYSPEFTKVPFYPESLRFELKWGILAMGEATLEVDEIVNFGAQPAYHILSKARTSSFADKFYKVRDVNESWIHVGDLRSLGYSKKLREGKFFRDEWVVYDYDKKTFLSKRVDKDAGFSYSTGTIPGAVQDILSSIYYIRPRKLRVGDEITLDVNTKSNWPLVIKVLRKSTVKVPAGRFRCVVVEPFLRKEGIFIQKGKRMQVWLSNDKRHIPVMLRVEIVFGSISGYLMKPKR